MKLFIPFPNVIIYSFFVQLLYILPAIIAISMVSIRVFLQVKHKKHESRNQQLSVWQRKYLLKSYEIDKTRLLQNRGKDFVTRLIRFAQKWWAEKHKNFNELCQFVTEDKELSQQLTQAYYTQKEIEKEQENRVKELLQKKHLQVPERTNNPKDISISKGE